MMRSLITTSLLLASLTGAFFAFSATADELPDRIEPSPPVVVTSDLARTRSWKLQVPTLGELEAVEGIEVTTKTAGRVRSIHFESGQRIEQGQLLVQLEDSTERARVETLRAKLARARAELVPDQPRGPDAERLQREIDSVAAELEEAQQLADDKRVLAPFSGSLGMREVHVGQFVRPGDVLVPLRRITPIRVEFRLPEQRFGAVEPGTPIEVRVGAVPERVFSGTVGTVEPWIDPVTRSFRLQGEIENGDGVLRPGMLAHVSVLLLEEREVVTIPSAAVRKTVHGHTVFHVDESADGALTVSRRFLKLGERRGSEVVVLSGLEAGARVVVASPRGLVDGATVTLAEPEATAGIP